MKRKRYWLCRNRAGWVSVFSGSRPYRVGSYWYSNGQEVMYLLPADAKRFFPVLPKRNKCIEITSLSITFEEVKP